jgi:hypothetical protein
MSERAKRAAESYTCDTLKELLKGDVEYDNRDGVDENVEGAKVGILLLCERFSFVSALHVLLNCYFPLIAEAKEDSRWRFEGRFRQEPDVSTAL